MVDAILARTLANVHDHVARCAGAIRFDISDEIQRHLLGYLATMLEVAGGCVALAESGRYVGIPILARTSLEAFVDLKLLLNDAAYVHSIAMMEQKGWIRLLRHASAGSKYLYSLVENLDLPAEIERREAEKRRREQLGGREWSTKDRWEAAGLGDEYEAMFRTLSAEAHNDGRAVGGRHFVVENDAARLVVYREDPPWVESVMLDAPRTLYQAAISIGERFEIAAFADEALEAEMDRVVRLVAGR